MSNSMFYTGLSGLNAAQAALLTTGHNTANVNTPGYSRQTAQIVAGVGVDRPGVGYFGGGATVTGVTRSYDQYLNAQLNQAQSTSQSLSTYDTQISQIDNLLASQTSGLAPQMQTFFTGVQAVANTPADPAARQQLISSGQAMTNQFRSMDEYLTGLSTSVNGQISGSVDQINNYADQIAKLNVQVDMLSKVSGSQAPNDLLDQRDQLVSQLGQMIGVKVVVQDGGQYNVFIGNGQTLVLGDKATQLAAVRSSSDPSQTAVSVRNAAGQDVQVADSVLTGGTLGGLLQFRNETLTSSQNSLGRIAIAMADSFNAQQNLGVDLSGAMGKDFFSVAAPHWAASSHNTGTLALQPTFSNTSLLTTSDYRLDVKADLSYSVTRLSDNHVFTAADLASADPANSFDGVQLAFTGTAAAGDSFMIQPTRMGARDLSVKVTDPSEVAAAAAVVSDATYGNKGTGAISVAKIDKAYLTTPLTGPVTLTYDAANQQFSGFPAEAAVTVTPANGVADPASPYAAGTPVPYTAGATLSFGGITVTISRAPADGDTFTIAKNTGGVSDGSNALLLGALQNAGTIGKGPAGGTGGISFNDAYAQLVSTVGNKARQLQIAGTAQTSLTTQIRSVQQSVSGVNQDEETANLLMYQQMYQANAKVIQTASTMFDAVLGIR
jgi:flagellar hook-associated protein 1 FlgK